MKLPALARTRVTAEPGFEATDLSAELYYYFHFYVFICDACLCGICTCVRLHVCFCAHIWRPGEDPAELLSFETGSLTKPNAKPEFSKPQQSSCICSSSVLGFQV